MSAKAGVAQRSHKAALLMATPPGWQRRAACRDSDPEIFHRRGAIKSALAVCATCTVSDQCGESRGPSDTGVWGGQAFYPNYSAVATHHCPVCWRNLTGPTSDGEIADHFDSIDRAECPMSGQSYELAVEGHKDAVDRHLEARRIRLERMLAAGCGDPR